jgi:hypothetical protein
MDRAKPQDEQGLRESPADRGGVHVRGDDALDGEAVGPLMSLLRQFLILFRAIDVTTPPRPPPTMSNR